MVVPAKRFHSMLALANAEFLGADPDPEPPPPAPLEPHASRTPPSARALPASADLVINERREMGCMVVTLLWNDRWSLPAFGFAHGPAAYGFDERWIGRRPTSCSSAKWREHLHRRRAGQPLAASLLTTSQLII